MKLRLSLLHSASAILVLSTSATSFADDSVSREEIAALTQQILKRPEFQPRRQAPGLLEQYREAIGEYLQRILESLSSWLRSLEGPKLGDSSIGEWLVNILVFLREVMYLVVIIGVVGVVVLIAYKLLAPYLKTREAVVRPRATTPSLAAETLPPLSDLLAAGRYREALMVLHTFTRRALQTRHQIPSSATDRELLATLGVESPEREYFTDLTQTFESAAYANRAVAQETVTALIQRSNEGGIISP